MAIRKLGNGYQCDFYAYNERIRKVFPTKKDAKAYEGGMLRAIRENRYFDIKQEAFQIFKELSDWYLSLEDIKRKKSFIRDRFSIGKLNDFFGTKPLRQMNPSMISDYQGQRLKENSYRGEATKPATINREIACLRTMFNKAVKDGKLERNPTKGVRFLKENNERERVLSPDEWENYKANCSQWFLPIAITAYRTAMRKGEIINLSPSRVDLKEGLIRLRGEDTKTNQARSIPIHSDLMEVLRKALKIRSLIGRVFHRDGKPIDQDNIRWAHERTCKKAGIEDFNFHDFRHTCINNWRKQGHDYFKIMAASGHKTISVFKRYNMVDEEEIKTLVNDSQKMVKLTVNPSEAPSDLCENYSMISGA